MGVTGRFAALVVATALCTVFMDSAPSHAQQDLIQQQLGKLATGDPDVPLLLQADQLIYDQQSDRVIAEGNVEVYYKNYALLADRLVYDQRANTLDAIGNVRIKEPDGALVNADRITLTDDFRDGFIRSFKAVTKDDARIAAAQAYRKGGETTVFERGIFTPCKPCEEHPERPPLWRIKAEKVIHKKSEGNIYYEDATLEFLGVPVFWVPRFSHPDPTVKRRSGFLTPEYGHSDELGFTVGTPYYFALSPHYDLTVTPAPTTEAGFLLKADWRQRLANGAYKVDLAGVYNDDPSGASEGKNEFRGSIVTKGDFNINEFWRWGWDATLESDRTFRRFYKLDSIYATDRISNAYLVGQSERNYFAANFYHLGGLTFQDDDESDSRIHPVIDYNYIFADPVVGGELSFDSNVLSLTRDDGTDSHRLIAETRWRRTFTDGIGQVITPFALARGDLYRVSGFDDGDDNDDDEDITRAQAGVGIEYRYPFVAHTSAASHVVEPIAQVIARTDAGDQDDIPNEDAQSLVFDDTLLFDIDKFSGYDRLETGTRANVGVQYTIQAHNGWNARTVIGQSYQLDGDNPFLPGTGLSETRSDYVAGLYLDFANNLQFISQARFAEDDFRLQRQDLALKGSLGPFTTAVNYVNAEAQPELGFDDDREEIAGSAGVRLAENWTLFGSARYDLALDEAIRESIGLRYADECFVLSVTYAQTHIEDGEIEPDQSVLVRFELKHLGGSDIKTDAIGPLSAETSAYQ